ncbi:TolC family protein [Pirellulaceae bacterium SH467]|jgi:outer membrane protein TolC
MKRNLTRWFVGMQIVSLMLTGCAPTQPFFIGERGDLSHYIDRAQQIEYPDLQNQSLPEVTQSHPPLSLDNQNFDYKDLTLEECISIALMNTQVIRALPGTQRQNADIAAIILSSPSAQLSTVYDPAIVANTTNSQPLVIDGSGNRVLARGAARANQVGGVEDALSEFDAQYSSFISWGTTDRARNVGAGNVFNPQFFQGRDGTAQMALSKRTATGGIATVRSQSIYSYNNIPTQSQGLGNFGRAVPSDYTQVLEAQVQHPLMRGRGTMVNRVPVVLARINEDIAIADYEERIRNLVREVEFAYWDLYAAYWNFATAKSARDSAALAYKIAAAKYNTGNAASQMAQASLTYHEFEAQVAAAFSGGGVTNQPGLLGRELNLRLLMGWAATDGYLIRPIDKPATGLAQFDWDSIQGEMLQRNVDLRKQKWVIKQKELELISSKNQILPDLNLNLIYRWVGVGGSLLNSNGGNARFPGGGGNASAWEELLGGNYQEGVVRMDFTPNAIGARRQLADITKVQQDLARAHRILEDKELSSSHLLTKYIQQLKSVHEQMTQQFHSIVASDNLVDVWRAKFEIGDSSNQEYVIDQLLRAQQSRARAGQAYNTSVAEYNKILVEIHHLKGSLLEYNSIMLEEGMWAEKAYWDASERARERDAARHMSRGASRPAVISQGEFEQFRGTANDQAREPMGQAPATDTPASELDEPETIPAVPERQAVPSDRKAQQGNSLLRS